MLQKNTAFPIHLQQPAAVVATASSYKFLFGLHIRDFSLKSRPAQLFGRRSSRLTVAASHISRQSDINAKTSSTTKLNLTHSDQTPVQTQPTTQLSITRWVLLC